MPWIIGGSAIASGVIGSSSASKAGKAQAAAIDRATVEQRRQNAQARNDLAPYRAAGTAALDRLQELLGIKRSLPNEAAIRRSMEDDYRVKSGGLDPSQPEVQASINGYIADMTREHGVSSPGVSPEDIMAMDPGYKFRLNEGLNATKNMAVARGGYDSGATLKALTRYGQDYASGEFNNIFNRLSGVAGTGQNATNSAVAAGTNAANTTSDLITQQGNARAAGIVGGANAWSGAAGGVAGAYNNYQNRQMLDRILNGGGGAATPRFDYTGYGVQGDYQYG